jgi:NurA-like 5'-3' nuclease
MKASYKTQVKVQVKDIFRILMLFPGQPRTKAGRTVQPPSQLADYETNAIAKYGIKLTDAENRYYEAMESYQKEFNSVESGFGGGFTKETARSGVGCKLLKKKIIA